MNILHPAFRFVPRLNSMRKLLEGYAQLRVFGAGDETTIRDKRYC